MRKWTLLVAVMAVAVGCGDAGVEVPPTPATAVGPVDDIAAAAPESVSVVLDNEWVRVMRIALDPGSALPLHEGGDRIVYALADYTIEWTEGDAGATEKAWTAGEAHWHEAGAHAVRNSGAGVAEYLVVERRGAALPAQEMTEGDAPTASVAADHAEILVENDAMRAARFELLPGESTGQHHGGYRLVYALSDYTIRWTEGDADPTEVGWTEGQAHWHGPSAHEVENIGDGPARYLVVTLLR